LSLGSANTAANARNMKFSSISSRLGFCLKLCLPSCVDRKAAKKRIQIEATIFELTMKTEQPQPNKFAVCLNNDNYEASLEVGKIYQAIIDEEASTNGLIRGIDESAEDYAFAANRFYPIEVPKPVEEVLLSVG